MPTVNPYRVTNSNDPFIQMMNEARKHALHLQYLEEARTAAQEAADKAAERDQDMRIENAKVEYERQQIEAALARTGAHQDAETNRRQQQRREELLRETEAQRIEHERFREEQRGLTGREFNTLDRENDQESPESMKRWEETRAQASVMLHERDATLTPEQIKFASGDPMTIAELMVWEAPARADRQDGQRHAAAPDAANDDDRSAYKDRPAGFQRQVEATERQAGKNEKGRSSVQDDEDEEIEPKRGMSR